MYGFLLIFELPKINFCQTRLENSEDTITLLNKYVDELPVDLNKNRLKNEIRTLYTEAQDLDI